MTERIFYTVKGSIKDGLVKDLTEAFNNLIFALTDISNNDHLHIELQGPNGEEVIKA